jgi:hypothetical protein
MPAIADITVKKADGATNIIYTGVAGAGGDASPAVFRSNSATGTIGQKPVVKVTSRDSGDKATRRVDISAVFPEVYTDSTTGLSLINSKVTMNASFAIPQNLSSTTMSEAAAQLTNLMASALIQSSISSGFAPT